MRTLGRHLIVELFGCTPARLDDLDRVRAAMLAATDAVGATRLSDSFHRFTPTGVSGAVVIAESHLSVHTWPDAGYAAVDIFTCGRLDPLAGIALLERALGASEVRAREIVRGLPAEVDAHARLRPEDVQIVEGPLQVPAATALEPRHRTGLDAQGTWFYEAAPRGIQAGQVNHGFRVEQLVCQARTRHQDVLIFDNPVYGRILVLDGAVQLSTSDERLYHELLVHPVMLSHPNPRRVLVVGGGDGGAVREVLRHRPDRVDMIDIDPEVLTLCQRHLPQVSAGAFDDPRLTVTHADASAALRARQHIYDVVIVDCNSATGPATPLFDGPFYAAVTAALRPGGRCALPTGSLLNGPAVRATTGAVAEHLSNVVLRRLTVPSLHCGECGFVTAGRDTSAPEPDPATLTQRIAARGLEGALVHYTPTLHDGSVIPVPGAGPPLAP